MTLGGYTGMMSPNELAQKCELFYQRLDTIKEELVNLTLDTRTLLDNYNGQQKTEIYSELEYIWRKCLNIQYSFNG